MTGGPDTQKEGKEVRVDSTRLGPAFSASSTERHFLRLQLPTSGSEQTKETIAPFVICASYIRLRNNALDCFCSAKDRNTLSRQMNAADRFRKVLEMAYRFLLCSALPVPGHRMRIDITLKKSDVL